VELRMVKRKGEKKIYVLTDPGNVTMLTNVDNDLKALNKEEVAEVTLDVWEKEINYYKLKSKIDKDGGILRLRIKETNKYVIIYNGEIHG